MAMLKPINPYSNGVGEKGLEQIQTIVDSLFSLPEIRMLPNKLANSFGGLALQQLKNWTLIILQLCNGRTHSRRYIQILAGVW